VAHTAMQEAIGNGRSLKTPPATTNHMGVTCGKSPESSRQEADVGRPELDRSVGGEIPAHQIGMAPGSGVGFGGGQPSASIAWPTWTSKLFGPSMIRRHVAKIVGAVVNMICADLLVSRALLLKREVSSSVIRNEPTGELVRCLEDAAAAGVMDEDLALRRLALQITTRLIGAMPQWAAGITSDVVFRARTRDFVDLVFMAGRKGDATANVQWNMSAVSRH
jgi:hypothetical protein